MKAFTYDELREAPACVHSTHHKDCPSCIRHSFWYGGRVAGIREVLERELRHALEETIDNLGPYKSFLDPQNGRDPYRAPRLVFPDPEENPH